MPLSTEQIEGLGVALNEASWHDLTIDESAASVSALMTVLARDLDGVEVTDPRRTLRFTGVSRVVASYRPAWFTDLAVLDGDGAGLDLEEFIAAGARWWEAMYAGERSDLAPGIVRAEPTGVRPRWWDRFRRTPR